MKILYVIHSLGAGGAELSLAESLPAYSARGIHPVIVGMRRREEGFQDQVQSGGFDLRFLSGGTIAKQFLQLRKIMYSEDIDLVHTSLIASDIMGRLAAAGTGIPVLTSIVNTSYDPARLNDPNVNRVKLRLDRMIDGWTARNMANHFHAITHAVKKAAIDDLRLPSERITVIERGRDVSRLGKRSAERRRRVRESLKIREDEEIALTVGRQEFQKGQRFLLEAIASLASSRSRLKLVMVGRKGSATDELRSLSRTLQLQDRVIWLGHRSDVPDLLAAADVFVFPSLFEGLGGALIEAMALELPIIASNIPSVNEVVENGRGALLAPVGSPRELARCITEILENPGVAGELGQRAAGIFHRRFTLDRSASRMAELYSQLVA
jgi:glycosyltransferase involved in cell wall biosynthesis